MKRIPNVFVIVSFLLLLAAVATWVLPAGSYLREEIRVGQSTRTVLVEGSYHPIAASPQHLQLFTAPLHGFLRLAEIIAFIFLVGGAFSVINATGAISGGIHRLVTRLQGREIMVVPLVMVVFSFFGAVFGMCEEAMPFVLVFVPLSLALGYDSLVGVCLTFVAAGVGFAGAFVNPFTLQIAQGIAGIEPLSGMGYRVVVWSVVTSVAIAWVVRYALKVKANPRLSPMYDLDLRQREAWQQRMAASPDFTRRHLLVLAILTLGIATMIVGVLTWDWYIPEIAGLFVAMGVSSGVAAGISPNAQAAAFVDGCKDMVSAGLVVAFAGGIIVILEAGGVMDTILYGLASLLAGLPALLAAYLQYMMQMVFNFFIPSGSTKAALTMPVMAPLADLSGITRQTAVLAYQLGDGFTNLIIPTSGVTIGTLAMAGIPYDRWFRWHLPLQAIFFLLSLALLIYPVLTHWS